MFSTLTLRTVLGLGLTLAPPASDELPPPAAAEAPAASVGGAPTATATATGPARRDPVGDAATRAHYDRVLAELAAADVADWPAIRRTARHHSLHALRRYRARADFGLSADPDQRQPGFIDDAGRRCAVAFILEAHGEHGLVDSVAAADNDGFVSELAALPGVAAAIQRAGLTIPEAARIQAPMGGPPRAPREAPAGPPRPGLPIAGDGRGAPISGSTSASRPTVTGLAGASSTRGSASRSSAGTTRGESGRGDTGRAAITSRATVTEPMEDWWIWWEMNKLRWLVPHDLDDAAAAQRSARYGSALERELARRRAVAVQLLTGLLDDGDAEIRGRAVVALGRIGGASVMTDVLPLLEDPARTVREAAVLALGATRSAAAVPRLLQLAERGARPGGAEVTPDVRALALLSLGLARRGGLNPSVDDLVASWAAELDDDLRADLAEGPFLYETLVGDPVHGDLARVTVEDRDARHELRCRAAEALRLGRDDGLVGVLDHALGSRNLELRRSAALALGQLRRPLVVGPLRTALELEHEPVTRGFLMLALGEQATPAAADQLTDELRRGNRSQRPFAALALGVLARHSADPKVRRTLRRELDDVRNRDLHGALLLACGIARDVEAVPLLERPLRDDADPRLRMFAALALGLIGGEGAHATLREAADVEPSPMAQVGVAQALALYGDPADTPRLIRTLRTMKSPDLQALVAVAVAFHGELDGLDALVDVSLDDSLPQHTRATAVEGLGLMLDPRPGLQLSAITRAANFRTFPEWLTRTVSTYTL